MNKIVVGLIFFFLATTAVAQLSAFSFESYDNNIHQQTEPFYSNNVVDWLASHGTPQIYGFKYKDSNGDSVFSRMHGLNAVDGKDYTYIDGPNGQTNNAEGIFQNISIDSGDYYNLSFRHQGNVIVKLTNGLTNVSTAPPTVVPDLNSVRDSIKANGHLPGMPSEKEVLDEGINVTEMLALQQQKIEELTLYLIQQQKMINELKAKVDGVD